MVRLLHRSVSRSFCGGPGGRGVHSLGVGLRASAFGRNLDGARVIRRQQLSPVADGRRSSRHSGKAMRVIYSGFLALVFVLFSHLLLASFSFAAEPAPTLLRSGPGLEPKPCVPNLVITLPRTDIKAGVFRFGDRDFITCKAGFVTADSAFFYIEAKDPREDNYDVLGDPNVGVHGSYVVLDAFAYGASHNRQMFLFRYGKGQIKLLDVIGKGRLRRSAIDFKSAGGKALCFGCFGRIRIEDVDGDGNPDIRLILNVALLLGPHSPSDNTVFEIYLKVTNDRLKVNLNPKLYRPLFERERARSEPRSALYYLYGFLSKRLGHESIRSALKREHQSLREEVIVVLEDVENWDRAFHENGGNAVLLKIDLSGR